MIILANQIEIRFVGLLLGAVLSERIATEIVMVSMRVMMAVMMVMMMTMVTMVKVM